MFAQLLKQMSQLPDNTHWCLIHWLRTYRIEWFQDIIAKIQQFISVRLFPPNPSDLPTNSKCAWWIPSATKVLALLCECDMYVSTYMQRSTEKLINFKTPYS